MVEEDESPEEMAFREAKEEAGLSLDNIFPIAHYLSSPGNTAEEVFIYGSVTDLSDAGGFHGVAGEHEDIRVIKTSADQAIEMFETGVICNALSVIAMMWFKANIQKLRRGDLPA